MILTPNNKISSMAKDFGVKNKTITDLLAQNGIEGKTHSSVLSPEEFSLVFEALTAQAQITNMAEYLGGTADIPRPEEEAAAKKKAEEEKAAAEAAKKAAEEEQKRRAAAEAAAKEKAQQEAKKQAERFANANPLAKKPQPKPKTQQREQPQKPSSTLRQGSRMSEAVPGQDTSRVGKTRLVDTRTSSVDLSKYDEKLDRFAPEQAGNISGGKQKLKKRKNLLKNKKSRLVKNETAFIFLKEYQSASNSCF